jgi:hypothetical protein
VALIREQTNQLLQVNIFRRYGGRVIRRPNAWYLRDYESDYRDHTHIGMKILRQVSGIMSKSAKLFVNTELLRFCYQV